MSGSIFLTPDDPGYAAETAGFQTGFPVRPERVVAARSPEDVRRAVAYAAERGLPLAVQATGHGLAGPVDGGVLVSTRRMDGVRVDPAARTARIEAGARWGQVVAAAAPHGLAPLNGSSPGVGAVSYTLRGGLGILGREFGWAADRVRSLELVTPDGEPRTVTGASDPELFGRLLGGGGPALGVVTALETGLVPVARLYGGSLLFADGEDGGVESAVRAWREWTAGMPEALTSSVAVMVYPELPFVPEHLRGRYTATVRIAYTGTAAEGERLVAPLRAAAGRPLADTLREMPYRESHTIHSDPETPHAYYGEGRLLGSLDPAAAAALLKATGPDSPLWTVVQLNHLGGALARPAANSVPHREAAYLVRLLSVLGDAPGNGTSPDQVRARYAEVFKALGPAVLGPARGFAFGAGDDAAAA
ncbi:FAD-binding oxidoreductase [Streptomyces lichenis]|uniref:FAD-dependent oxidoreductase n=1 Tax=Streptomyces lichenis TaxID=2306967 RepID=A0ABT0I670_9ACTN|nr:FAD-dependent oxidoreductase [Streptomyces lichenis]MCK8676820.1 FAD-dependent oxidoreductase [Streptomyces lichenis]